MANGVVARIWDAPVMDRYIALIQALAQRYDSNPYVEGISTVRDRDRVSSALPCACNIFDRYALAQLATLYDCSSLGVGSQRCLCRDQLFRVRPQMQALIDSAVKIRPLSVALM